VRPESRQDTEPDASRSHRSAGTRAMTLTSRIAWLSRSRLAFKPSTPRLETSPPELSPSQPPGLCVLAERKILSTGAFLRQVES
jgi:hypothetical protein